jgi:hypothetical protein
VLVTLSRDKFHFFIFSSSLEWHFGKKQEFRIKLLTKSYLKYANIGAAAIRSVLKEDAKAIAMKRAEIALKRTIWKDGRIAESVIYC